MLRGISSLIGMAVLSLFFGCSSPGFLPGSGRPMNGLSLHALIDGASRTNRVPATLVAAMVDAESHGDPSAVSRAGAQGIMQLMPATSSEYGVTNPFDPRENIDGGTRYLHDLLRRYHGNVTFAVAAYNAGPGAVDVAHGIPPFPETRAYVARVLTAYSSR